MKGSFTKTTTIKRCLRKAMYRYVLELRRKRKTIQLERGSLIHKCLDTYYKTGDASKAVQVIQDYITNTWSKLMDEEKAEYGDLPGEVYRIVAGYIRAYREHDKGIVVVGSEIPVEVDHGGHTFEGIVDLLVKDDAGMWVVDHKTVKTIPEENLRHTDIQLLMYVWALRKMGYPVTGAMVNYIKTKPPQMPTLTQKGTMSKSAIDTDWPTYHKALVNAGLNPSDYEDMREKLAKKAFVKRVRVPAVDNTMGQLMLDFADTMELWSYCSEKGLFTRALTRDCTWDCEFCPICFAELSGSDPSVIIENDYVKGGEKNGDESYDQETELDFE